MMTSKFVSKLDSQLIQHIIHTSPTMHTKQRLQAADLLTVTELSLKNIKKLKHICKYLQEQIRVDVHKLEDVTRYLYTLAEQQGKILPETNTVEPSRKTGPQKQGQEVTKLFRKRKLRP